MSTERIAQRFVVAAVIGLSIAWLIWAFNGFSLTDANAYRLAAERLIHGQNIYAQAPNQDEAFRYAPWFAVAWVPIAALPKAAGDALWLIALAGASVVAVLPLARQASLAARLLAALGVSMLLWTTARGNVHPLVMLALIHGLERRAGPLWVALAASIKAVPILFVLIYLAKREWWRAILTVAITALLVLPMPFLGWHLGTVDAGESLSLYYLVSPVAWAVVAVVAVLTATAIALRAPRYAPFAAAVAAILSLPRLLLYDLTYVLVGAGEPWWRGIMRD
ncbi:MAG: glycosyltransferase 87 family protein [Chloroflexota bacterium]|nr:glycosyltransferase 87 family protein [Chloroflexota bacterium]